MRRVQAGDTLEASHYNDQVDIIEGVVKRIGLLEDRRPVDTPASKLECAIEELEESVTGLDEHINKRINELKESMQDQIKTLNERLSLHRLDTEQRLVRLDKRVGHLEIDNELRGNPRK